MPAKGRLKDRQIADVLSYIRTVWGGKSQVQQKDVSRIRAETQGPGIALGCQGPAGDQLREESFTG
ncbi:MAG: hypothetical protein HOK49_00660 [Opitutae bacterium]|nr:hypothetical protein [Opitutae bacterium]MBT7853405.1 hypothetical protein [Opitutae bacterium]